MIPIFWYQAPISPINPVAEGSYLVSEDDACLGSGSALVHVRVGPANGRGRDLDNFGSGELAKRRSGTRSRFTY